MEQRELVSSFALAQLRSLSVCSLRAHSDKDWKPRKQFVCAVYVKVVAAHCDLVISEPSSAVPQFRSSIGIMSCTEHRQRHDIRTHKESRSAVTLECRLTLTNPRG